MKKQNISLFLGALMATTVVASAQLTAPLDLEILFDGNAMVAASGSAAVEPDTLAVTPNGSTLYLFDSNGGVDALFSYNLASPPVTTGTSFATEAQLSVNTNTSAGDLASDANNVYTSIFDSTAAKQLIWRIPYAGFGTAAQVVDSTGSATVNMDEIAVDSKNSLLVIGYNDAFSAAAEDVVTVSLSATNGTTTVLATEAAIEAVLASISGYVDDTAVNDDLNISDLTVQSDGDTIISHGFSSNREINGSLLRITDAGAISVFRTGADIITAAGGDAGLYDIGSVGVAAIPASAGASAQDQILIFVPFTSNAAVAPFVAVVSADGTSQRQIATDAQLLGHLTAPEQASLVPTSTFFRFDSKSTIALDANGDAYFYRQAGSASTVFGANAVLKLSGIVASPVSDWSKF